MNGLSAKWQKLIVWLSGYLGITSFLIGAGFVYLKTDDDDVKNSCKTVLVLLAVFTGASILFSTVLYNLFALFDMYNVTSVFSDIATAFNIIKAILFVTLFILDLCGIKLALLSGRRKSGDDGAND